MTDSERLYFEAPLLCDFEATVLRQLRVGQHDAVILDRTAFYPESGGQMADLGTLGEQQVTDVQLIDKSICHVLSGAAPVEGSPVQCRIDRERRREHMALHTGQHILSRALLDVAVAQTVSSRLGETACTIDVDRDVLPDATLMQVEALANAIVDDDMEVRAFFPTAAELAGFELRRPATVAEAVRVVQIGDYDVTPCGGTHCLRTAQVGQLAITGIERHKRRARLSFVAGKRARSQLGSEAKALRQLARSLSCGSDDVAGAIDKLRGELAAAKSELKAVNGLAAEHVASSLIASTVADAPLVARLEGAPVALLREVARHVTQRPDSVALLATTTADGMHLLASRGSASSFDCGALIKRITASHGGRGGGRADRAEGRLPTGIAWSDIEAEIP